MTSEKIMLIAIALSVLELILGRLVWNWSDYPAPDDVSHWELG